MGQWGVRSYENDDAADALDAGLDQVHDALYEELMDDRNPLTPDQVARQLSNPATLEAALAALVATVDLPWEDWDDTDRLAYAGVVVRHAEFQVPIPAEPRDRAAAWLRSEDIDWEEATARRLRRDREIRLLTGEDR